jgi:hypothetical protein
MATKSSKTGPDNAVAPTGPVLELKPLKNVMPIVPAQQVDSSSCPTSGETSPLLASAPNGKPAGSDNDESGVENITQVSFLFSLCYFLRFLTHQRLDAIYLVVVVSNSSVALSFFTNDDIT